jgi:hypothetical protein
MTQQHRVVRTRVLSPLEEQGGFKIKGKEELRRGASQSPRCLKPMPQAPNSPHDCDKLPSLTKSRITDFSIANKPKGAWISRTQLAILPLPLGMQSDHRTNLHDDLLQSNSQGKHGPLHVELLCGALLCGSSVRAELPLQPFAEDRHVANRGGARLVDVHASKIQETQGLDTESADRITAVEASGSERSASSHEQSKHGQACAGTADEGATVGGSGSLQAVRRITRPSTKDVHLLF